MNNYTTLYYVHVDIRYYSELIKNFDILTTNLNVLHNYFGSSIKLFSYLYLTKFLVRYNNSNQVFLKRVAQNLCPVPEDPVCIQAHRDRRLDIDLLVINALLN